MAARYVLSPEAAQDLFEIWDYVQERTSREIADHIEYVIRERVAFLSANSNIGPYRKDITTEAVSFSQCILI